MGEFELIDRFFRRPTGGARGVVLGVGDDCALLAPQAGMQLAVSTDLLLEGRHFFPDVDPSRLGHKSLAVNLSDLAACGARPLAFTLALALPAPDEAWLAAFAGGLLALADAHGCALVGGDTTRGPLAICITVFGEVPTGQALLRSGAQAGDDLYVSGTLGDARLALEALRGTLQLPPALLAAARDRLEQPSPRVALGQALRGIATSAIDLSDGLLGDVGHVLRQSGVGARIDSTVVHGLLAARRSQPQAVPDDAQLLPWVLAGGDDYELAFTAPPLRREMVQAAAGACGVAATCIGRIEAEPGLRLVDGQGRAMQVPARGFDHFA